MNLWILVFMFSGQPAVSGPHELEVCLQMADTQRRIASPHAHCWNYQTRERVKP